MVWGSDVPASDGLHERVQDRVLDLGDGASAASTSFLRMTLGAVARSPDVPHWKVLLWSVGPYIETPRLASPGDGAVG